MKKKALILVLILCFGPVFYVFSQVKEKTTWEGYDVIKEKTLNIKFFFPDNKDQHIIQAPVNALNWKEKRTLHINVKILKKRLRRVKSVKPFSLELSLNLKKKVFSFPLGSFEFGRKVDLIPDFLKVPLSAEFVKELVQSYLMNDIELDQPSVAAFVFKDKDGGILVNIDVFCSFPFRYKNWKFQNLDTLIVKEKFMEAENFCEKLDEDHKGEAFGSLGEAFFVLKKYEKAAQNYERAGYRKGVNRVADAFFRNKEYSKAVLYYEKGAPASDRAFFYAFRADNFKKDKNPGYAKIYYKKAVDDFEFLIKSFYYKWNRSDSRERRRCIYELKKFPRTVEEEKKHQKLNNILKQAEIYCENLSRQCHLFFCKEVISDYMDPSRVRKNTVFTNNNYVYDYQLIKKDGKIKETRILLKENTARVRMKNAILKTNMYYENLIFGPEAFFAKKWRKYFDFKIIREYKDQRGSPIVVIEAIPYSEYSSNQLMGEIYFRKRAKKYQILKLVWNPKTIIKNFSSILEMEKALKSKLKINFFAEFEVDHKGVRLPSKYFFEVFFVRKSGRKYLFQRIKVKFTDHQYFDVGTDVTKISPSIEEETKQEIN